MTLSTSEAMAAAPCETPSSDVAQQPVPNPLQKAAPSAPQPTDYVGIAGINDPADLRRLPQRLLPTVADDLRRELINVVSTTGGHFGASLGVIELTVALHYQLETPADKIIWDVSHQCYPHKILTGRREALYAVRQSGGPSGFTCRTESAYDPFGAAHSSTSISSGLGFALARDLRGQDTCVVAVIGDGALSGGMAYEALNNAGAQRRRMIVVLNDNDMSIAPPSGALRAHLCRLKAAMPDRATRHAAIAQGQLVNLTGEPTLFDALGVHYAGPFDGHDVNELADVLALARDAQDGPILLHVITDKGHGFAPAEAADDKWHAVAKFDPQTGAQKKSAGGPPSFTSVFAKALISVADTDPDVVAITAAMPSGTGLDKFQKRFPQRCFDAGIAEQHAVTFAAGLACEGLKPFAAIYSTFLQRAFDQVVHDVAIQKLPVRFAIDRAGLVGADGATHQGSYDVSYLSCLPNFVLMAPADEAELVHMVATAAAIDDRPSALRYPRGAGTGVDAPDVGEVLTIGKGRVVREGSDVAIISYGATLANALTAADLLAAHGLSATVADARFAKPIDDDLVRRLAKEHRLLVTLEEGAIGGFATQVVDSLTRQMLDVSTSRLLPLHLPDVFIQHDTQASQAETAALDAASIARQILSKLGGRSHFYDAAE